MLQEDYSIQYLFCYAVGTSNSIVNPENWPVTKRHFSSRKDERGHKLFIYIGPRSSRSDTEIRAEVGAGGGGEISPMATACCSLSGAMLAAPDKALVSPMRLYWQGISAAAPSGGSRKVSILQARASVVDSSGFAKRMERAWIISKVIFWLLFSFSRWCYGPFAMLGLFRVLLFFGEGDTFAPLLWMEMGFRVGARCCSPQLDLIPALSVKH